MSSHFNKPFNEDGSNDGYLTLKIAYWKKQDDGHIVMKQKDCYVHRLVMMTFEYFYGCELFEAKHINSDKTDNRYPYNLEWVTRDQNVTHVYYNKKRPTGSSLFTILEVNQICTMLQNNIPVGTIAEKFKCKKSTIEDIKYGKTYGNISKDFNIVSKKKPKATNDNIVHEICRRLENGDRIIDICNELNVKRHVVNDIKAGRNHADISSQYNIPDTRGYLPESEVRKICELLQQGYSASKISNMLNISEGTIAFIRARKTFVDISKDYKWDNQTQNSPTSKDVVRMICNMLQNGMSCKQISDITGTEYHVIENIHCRKYYTDISKDYIW
jgi:hypothetical protein